MLALPHNGQEQTSMKLFVIRFIMRVLSWVTPKAAEYMAPPLAGILWYLSPRKRRATRLNLRAAFPEMDAKQREKIGRASMTHYIRGVFEAGMLWYWPMDKVSSYFEEMRGQAYLDEALRSGKGTIVAAPHCGAWEMLNLFMHQYGPAILYKPGRQVEFDQLLLEKRRRSGANMIPANASGIRSMFKILKAGGLVALLPDQEPSGGEGQFAPFFGIEALTGVLLPRLARRTGAPVLFSVCERIKGGRYQVHFFKADESIYDEDMRIAATAVNRGIEDCIAVDTNQYLWAYKRFRNRPVGERPFYKR